MADETAPLAAVRVDVLAQVGLVDAAEGGSAPRAGRAPPAEAKNGAAVVLERTADLLDHESAVPTLGHSAALAASTAAAMRGTNS